MTKPKFTPDPPPVGASREEQLAWFQRQFDRIEDWWPKDLEDRLKALEIAFPYKSGTWPIVDSSSVSFRAESTIPEAACSDAIWPVESNETAPFIADIASSGYDLTVQSMVGHPDDGVGVSRVASVASNYLYNDAQRGWVWDQRYIWGLTSAGRGMWGLLDDNSIAEWVESSGYIEFYIKPYAQMNSSAQEGYVIDCTNNWLGGNNPRFRVYVRGNNSAGPPYGVTFTMRVSDGSMRWRTDTYDITSNTWHKVRIDYDRSLIATPSRANAITISVDNLQKPVTFSGNGTTDSHITGTFNLTIGCRNTQSASNIFNPGETGPNCFLDAIKLSHCGYL